MQLLLNENNSPSRADSSGDECARHVLDVTPPVIRTIRELMRNHRLRGITVPQFRAMARLSRSPKASLSAVADHVGCSLPAASRMIDVLVAQKLVIRHQCPSDRRQISLALTPRGNEAFLASRRATRKQLAKRLQSLSTPQRKSIVQAMNLLAEIFGSDADQLCPTQSPQKSSSRSSSRSS
jgi:DNA-binding MarR family transcriptional regulator